MSCEILIDGGFETTAVGSLPSEFDPRLNLYWHSSSGIRPHVVEDRSKAHGGSRFLRFEIPSDISSSIHVVAIQSLTTSPGTDYRLRYWVKTSGSFVYGDFFQVEWNDNVINHSKLNSGTLQSMSSLPYQEFEFVVTASGPTSVLTFVAFISNGSAPIYLDDVSVCPSVVRNGNFETGNLSSWTLSTPMNGSVANDDSLPAHGGIYSALMFTTSMEQSLFTIPGAKYELSYWIQKIGGYSTDEFFEAQWNDTYIDGSRLDFFNQGETENQYRRFKFEVDAGPNPSLLKFIFNVSGAPFQIDNIALTLKGSSEDVPCYLKGTHILTPKGEILIDDLKEGDEVFTYENGKLNIDKIKWKGSLIPKNLNDESYPIKICNSAIRKGVPHRDLFISPGHSVFIDGKLVPAKSLVNGLTIYQDKTINNVQYYHIELNRHSIVFAEGMCAESYLDVGNRNSFSTKV